MCKINYRVTSEDYQAWLELMDPGTKRRRKESHYQGLFMHLLAIAIGVWVSISHEEGFAACLLVALALHLLWGAGSFGNYWKSLLETYARDVTTHQYELEVSENGFQQNVGGVEVRVPWSLIEGFAKDDQCLMIRYQRASGFIVPIRSMEPGKLEELLDLLRTHRVLEVGPAKR